MTVETFDTAAWCRIGLTGIDAGCDLLTALVPGELARRLDELLPGVTVVPLTEGPGPLPVELDPQSRRRDEVGPGDLDAVAAPELVGAGLDLLADSRIGDPDSGRWRDLLPIRGELGDGPVVVVEVGRQGADVGGDAGVPAHGGAASTLLVDPHGGDRAVRSAVPGIAAVEPDAAAGPLLDAYLHAAEIRAWTPGGRRLATPVDAAAVVRAEDAVAAVADEAYAAVIQRDGTGAARRQLTSWARWGRAVDAAGRAAEQRHRRQLARMAFGGEHR